MDYFNQESDRLYYRKTLESDIPDWTSFFIENDSLKYLGIDLSKQPETHAKDWIERQKQRYAESGLGHLTVTEKSSGNLVGMAGIIPRDLDGMREFEIAYSLKPEYWGMGYGTEMAKQIKQYGIQAGISKTFISIIDKQNIRSIRVAEKNGMSIKGETHFLGLDVYIFST